MEKLRGGPQAKFVWGVGGQNLVECLGQLVCWSGAPTYYGSKRVPWFVGLYIAVYITNIVIFTNLGKMNGTIKGTKAINGGVNFPLYVLDWVSSHSLELQGVLKYVVEF